MASKTVSIALDSPSARRIAASLAPWALSTADCFSPSAVRICDCLTPSAVRIVARRSRSARICFSIASWIVVGRVDRLELDAVDPDAPRPVRSSSTIRSWSLTWSRLVSVSSRVSEPMMLRSVVTVSCSMACSGLATS